MSVDFYLIQSQQDAYQWANIRYLFVCQLVEKVWKKGHSIYLHTNNPQDAQQLDNLLWTFRQHSFIPHSLANKQEIAAVKIGCEGWESQQKQDILINLAPTIPTHFNQFSRILEVLTDDPQIKQMGREHYKFYKQQNYSLNTHTIQR